MFDVETTGLDPETCEIIEIGACKVKNGMIIDEFSSGLHNKFFMKLFNHHNLDLILDMI